MDTRQHEGFITGSPAPSDDEKTWGMLAHLSGLLTSFVGPLVIMLTKGKESSWVEQQAREALNFHITVLIALSVAGLTCLLAAVLVPLVGLTALVMGILATVKANSGAMYRYPATLRLVK